jgi:hypothetical protein
MPQECNAKMQIYFDQVLYVGTDSADLTTNLVRRLKELTGEMTARFKAIIVAAGSSN